MRSDASALPACPVVAADSVAVVAGLYSVTAGPGAAGSGPADLADPLSVGPAADSAGPESFSAHSGSSPARFRSKDSDAEPVCKNSERSADPAA